MINLKSEFYERTIKVVGEESMKRLCEAKIAVFGAGGVGGAVIESLARAGIGYISVFDCDEFTQSNLNRQILATLESVGRRKVEVARDRIFSINPKCVVEARDLFITPEIIEQKIAQNACKSQEVYSQPEQVDSAKCDSVACQLKEVDGEKDIFIDFKSYDYVIDAIDNVTAKIAIIRKCKTLGIPVISCMGTGNKLDASRFRIGDISETSVCPLARVIRRELSKTASNPDYKPICLDVLWSDEPPISNIRPPGSISFVPPVAGMLIAGFVVRKLI